MTAEEPPYARRLARRNRVLLAGIVCYGQGAHWFDCTIRDLTENGARLRIPEHQQVPTSFHLIVIRDQIAWEATLAWRKGAELGVSLLRSISLAPDLDPALAFLRQLWLVRAPR